MNVDLGELETICRFNAVSYVLEFEESTGLYSASTSSPSPEEFFEIKKMSSPQSAVDALVGALRGRRQ